MDENTKNSNLNLLKKKPVDDDYVIMNKKSLNKLKKFQIVDILLNESKSDSQVKNAILYMINIASKIKHKTVNKKYLNQY